MNYGNMNGVNRVFSNRKQTLLNKTKEKTFFCAPLEVWLDLYIMNTF